MLDDLFKEKFLEYAKKRNFSDSLINKCIQTLSFSIDKGDGCLWTDTLLWSLVQSNDCLTSKTLSSTIGLRGDLLNSFTADETLATNHLTFSPSFQTTFDEELQKLTRANPNYLLDEDEIVLIEIRWAVEEYGHSHSPLVSFAEYLLIPLKDYFFEFSGKIPRASDIWRFENQFIAAFILAHMAKQHPLDAFTSIRDTAIEKQLNVPEKRRYLKFLYYLRDSVHIATNTIPDRVLFDMSNKWDSNIYEQTLQDIEYEVGEDCDQATDAYHSSLFAASKLFEHGVSLPWLLDRLENKFDSKGEVDWPNNEALLLSLNNGLIQVNPADILGVQKVVASPFGGKIEHANTGLIIPNPIWNRSVIDRLEHLVNKKQVKENEIQLFFEMYPDFILSDLHVSIAPQVVLYQENNDKSLRPDFILKRANSSFVDIVEIKRPIQKIVTGTNERPYPTRSLASAIAQLKEYGEWFRDKTNRSWFRKRYGLDGYEPSLTLIIGRSSGFINEEIKTRVISGSGVNIVTYDDLLTIAKNRSASIFSR